MISSKLLVNNDRLYTSEKIKIKIIKNLNIAREGLWCSYNIIPSPFNIYQIDMHTIMIGWKIHVVKYWLEKKQYSNSI